MPPRLTIRRRMLAQGAVGVLPLAEAVVHARDELARMRREIMARVQPVASAG